jgi:DNA-binding MarR family transcriptional regulator
MRAIKYDEYNQYSMSKLEITSKELLIIMEIGYDNITSASRFVDYIFEKHSFSKSAVWYNLKKMKKKGTVDFAEKGEKYRPLSLTQQGVELLRRAATQNTISSAYRALAVASV